VTSTQPLEHVSFDEPDSVREGDNWRLELLDLAGGVQVGRITVQTGWSWSQDVKPVGGTDLCMAPSPTAGEEPSNSASSRQAAVEAARLR
jgi:hypothetical protein